MVGIPSLVCLPTKYKFGVGNVAMATTTSPIKAAFQKEPDNKAAFSNNEVASDEIICIKTYSCLTAGYLTVTVPVLHC